ncbi:MAG: hypothetical protein KAI17_17125, partial [Thiotrichaceae bacterium]|nr:hypothetical protein [Thiotrichaceae bacterium]
MQTYMQRMKNMIGDKKAPLANIEGVPLHTLLFAEDGTLKMETRLDKLSTDNISSIQMSVPADFSLTQMPGM